MNKSKLLEKLNRHKRPVIVEFWAPWCGPCKMMAPALEKSAKEFNGQVDLVKINADEHPELLRELRIFGIPSILAYADGQELFRRTGAQSPSNLRAIFTAASERKSATPGLAVRDRILRAAAGALVVGLGFGLPDARLLVIPGAALLFSAVYDRCPIYKALSGWVKEKFAQRQTSA